MNAPPVLPSTAPFDAAQRAWLNGYLAGLFAAGGTPPPAASEPTVARRTLTILFGTQTGSSAALARRFARALSPETFTARAVGMDEFATLDFSRDPDVLLITSTYGDGEMPENAHAFWAHLNGPAAPRLTGVRFAVLALGDRNYPQFCQAGIDFDRRFAELGATRVLPRVDCDVDYDVPASAWLEAAKAAFAGTPATSSEIAQVAADGERLLAHDAAPAFSRKHPYPARLLVNRPLSGAGSEKETRHFELALGESGLAYEAGDALGVWPTNCPELVQEVLDRLEFDGEEEVGLADGSRGSLRRALSRDLDLRKPGEDLLRFAAHEGGDTELAALLAPEQRPALQKMLWGREVIDFLSDARGKTAAPDFAAMLRKIQPRLYSIASSPKVHPGEVHLTVSVVRHESHGRMRKGVCSTFLADRAASAAVPVFVQTSHGFRLPADGARPIIMVGPGTGIAPFRAFLEERGVTGATGGNWLFFGEQRASVDFLYQDELETMRADGHLTRLETAFSRDQAEKIYVQHRLLEAGRELWAWLQEGAHFYVCGDASRMAKDVDAALHQIVEREGGLSADGAAEFVTQLKKEKRYQRDVY